MALKPVVCVVSLSETIAGSVYGFLRLPLSQVTLPHANSGKAVNMTSVDKDNRENMDWFTLQ